MLHHVELTFLKLPKPRNGRIIRIVMNLRRLEIKLILWRIACDVLAVWHSLMGADWENFDKSLGLIKPLSTQPKLGWCGCIRAVSLNVMGEWKWGLSDFENEE
ncbi:hypothetical protein Tco_0506202 [Tanacetum coccineum]